jgi:hypothetical protein
VDLTLDRICVFNGIEYRIIEILNSGNLLVVTKEDYENENFPLQTYVIPGE